MGWNDLKSCVEIHWKGNVTAIIKFKQSASNQSLAKKTDTVDILIVYNQSVWHDTIIC